MYQSLLKKIDLKNKNSLAIAGGFLSTFFIFLVIYIIILPSGKGFNSVKDSSMVDFVRLKKNDFLNERQRALPEKPPPPKKPPPTKLETPDIVEPVTPNLDIKFPDIKTPIDLKGAMLQGSNSLASNSALIPLVRIAPRYPRDALMAGKTGYVTIQLTVDEEGKVINAVISESRPPRIFDRAALSAVLRWKFKPRVIDGVAVQQVGSTTIEFNL